MEKLYSRNGDIKQKLKSKFSDVAMIVEDQTMIDIPRAIGNGKFLGDNSNSVENFNRTYYIKR